jgi:hypothetical protein
VSTTESKPTDWHVNDAGQKLLAKSVSVGIDYTDMQVRIEYANNTDAEHAYGILRLLQREFGPKENEKSRLAKERRRQLFLELYEEFGSEV